VTPGHKKATRAASRERAQRGQEVPDSLQRYGGRPLNLYISHTAA
jgi:hypothetical protein